VVQHGIYYTSTVTRLVWLQLGTVSALEVHFGMKRCKKLLKTDLNWAKPSTGGGITGVKEPHMVVRGPIQVLKDHTEAKGLHAGKVAHKGEGAQM